MVKQLMATIVCPLEVERRALLRAGLGGQWAIVCCGPGAEGIERWFSNNQAQQELERSQPIVLAGVAGGISGRVRAGEAYVVSRVLVGGGRWLEPTWAAVAEVGGVETAVVAGSDVAVVSANDKRVLAEGTGADLVDMESAAFAEAATAAGRPWAIVRGVSDDAGMNLPRGVETWVDEMGRTRGVRVAQAMMCRPWLVGDLLRLGRCSKAAMASVARVLAAVSADF